MISSANIFPHSVGCLLVFVYGLTEEGIKKMWCIYTMEYYSAIKENKIMSLAATQMELEILILNELRQKEKDKYHTSHIWIRDDTIYKTETDHGHGEQACGCQRGVGRERGGWESGVPRCKLL